MYDPTTLGDFLYFPITLLVYTPFTLIERVPAAAIALALGGGVLHLGVYQACALVVVRGLEVDRRAGVRGVVLLVDIPAAWFNFKGVQAQVPMSLRR